ncbi:MAG: RICIN domain-containing protein [Cytophagaceae bacterium]|nr:RICIN domain-containing protein [Cytophagaceae bacterium]
MYKIIISLSISFFLLSSLSFQVKAQTVNSWVTNANQSALLQQQTAVNFAPGIGPTISVNDATTYQTIDGYGFCLTEGSAEAISNLNAAQQDNLLNEFFNTTTGMGNSVLRISIGASDLSSSSYSYNDGGVDVNQNNFSLAGPDLTYIVPLVKRILQINPNIKILATPWSAPRWMKTNNAWIGGSLNTAYYASYATYFVKYINAMKAQGINIWAVTPQNEPENPYNEPSMAMNGAEQTTFINNNLGPAFQSAGFSTKIIAFDHNCDNTAYPTQVLNGSGYVDGAAFHLYAGNISALTTVHNNTGKNVYFTEQFTSSNGGFAGDFPWHMQNVMIGSMNNWAKTALEWNLATNASLGPKTPGGCTECLGAVTINNSTSYTRNVSYYIIAQLSKFVKTGAVRIASSSSNGSLQNVAFKNPDGSIVLIIFNSGGNQTFAVGSGSNTFSYTLAGSSAVSFVWSAGIPPTTGLVTVYKDCNYTGFSAGLEIGDYNLARLQSLGVQNDDISSLQITEGYQVILYQDDNFGGGSTVINSTNNCLNTTWNDKVTSLRILPNGATNVTGNYFLQNRNSGLFMDVFAASTADGANISQGLFNGNTNQQFTFTHLGNGLYQALAVHSGKSIDVSAISTADGANVQQWTNFGSANQKFIVVPTGDGFYKLVASHSGKVVEVANAGTANGDNIQQWTNNNQTCGQWKFKPVTTPGTGTGLAGNYFNGMNFDLLKYSRTDANVNFDWGTGTPNATVNTDLFSVRWTGQIQPEYTDEYTFYITSDNGRRLWINDQLIVDKWLDDVSENTGKITLTAGQKYEIKLEYFENNGGANCKLEWSSFLQDRELIPQTQLFPNILPTISITSPANNAGFTAPASITINATAGDDGSIAKVDFYNGTTWIGTNTATPYSFTWPSVASGTYAITALATDNRGGVTLSSAVTVKVNQPPTVSITSPANNATYVGNATINFTATASDTDGSVSKVEYYNGASLIGSATIFPYAMSWTNVGVGTYTITAKATDNLGVVTTSAAISVIVNANQLPTVSITSPANNAAFISPASVSITATANDIDGLITKVEFYNGTALLGSDNNLPYNYSWTGVTAGTYSLTAKAYDDKTGITTSSIVTIVVSNPNQPPTVFITSPTNSDHFTAPAAVSIAATAEDLDGSIMKVEFYNGTTKLGEDATSPYSFDWTGVAEGSYALTAAAIDQLGLTTFSSVFTLVVDPALSTGMEDSHVDQGIVLYPNPVSDELTITSSILNLSYASYQLMDITGRIVLQGASLSQAIRLISLESGVYTIIIINGDRTFIRRIIKH